MNELFAFLNGILAALVPGWGHDAPPQWNGYVEASYVYAASATGGAIDALAVKEGDVVAKGAVLYTLGSAQQAAALAGAEARVKAAQASLDNLTTGGRKDEIDVIRATLSKAEADVSLARDSAARSGKLFAQGLVPQSKLDQDRTALASAEAAVRQLQAQLKVAELPARDAQQAQAEANLAAARADVDKARADLGDRTVLAPMGGKVERLYFDAGEVSGAGAPVLELLPADSLKVKFYVPEALRAQFKLGDTLTVSCDGCAAGLVASVSYFATEPQFTPPVIYSKDERGRLSYLIEAVLADDAQLRPGQPVSVERAQ